MQFSQSGCIFQLCIHSFLQPKDTRKYDEASSLHVMMEVMIYGSKGREGIKKSRQGTQNFCQDLGKNNEVLLQQIEFFGAADGCSAVVHTQLGVNVLGVGTQSAQGHYEFTGNFRAVQISSEQPEHFQFTFA